MATPEAPLREILKSVSFTQFPLRVIEPFFVADKIVKPRLYIYPSFAVHKETMANDEKRPMLPTFDVKSLYMLTALKFAKYDFDIAYTSEPDASPDGSLPFLLLRDGTALDFKAIMSKLQQNSTELGCATEEQPDYISDVDGDLEMPKNELPSEPVYRTMVENNLLPVIEYLTWTDPVGRECIGEGKYLGSYPQIIRNMLSWIAATDTAHKLKLGLPEYGADAMVLDGEVLYENAFRTLDSLLVLLHTVDDSRLFLAGAPSLLDALVFACVNVFLYAPVKSPVRTALLKSDSTYKPVLEYAVRIFDQYFASA
ncbi:hypothetical protein GGI25_001693 [Coemansia spiralis]|uniref:Mitochondrial outer membrane transport complex Sam37/metaxin N-terminal domain-containing protein n=1 Tax=Coemansia spiralis TaxID=417178 RepID=A0A9W8G983_9FUNG|nr:hypothetical protein BX070DRAFT_221113 [Coemansia spiralis]KAJ2624967.1 hypothetical protein GGI26_001079 [Coemansia sp. RSA 1358]KAJ2679125.1 hypothetical protein GGI25_001693 [Coemansia spiralis]